MLSSKIRFGIVGAGNIARKFAEDILLSEYAVLSGVASRDIKKAEAFKEKYNVTKAFGSYEEMANCDFIDAVYIATPHNFHKPNSILYLNHKKHVLCEKPVAVNKQEFEEMAFAAKSNKVLLMEAMWTRFLPVSKEVKQIVLSKKYGAIKSISVSLGMDLKKSDRQQERLHNKNIAAGSLLDLGVYPISYVLSLITSNIKDISIKYEMNDFGYDLSENIIVHFENDITANIKSSMIENLDNKAVINFHNHTLVVDDFIRANYYLVNNKKYTMEYNGGGFTPQIDSFCRSIRANQLENHIMTHNESRKVMSLMDEIRSIMNFKYPFE